jgi:urease accessory protein
LSLSFHQNRVHAVRQDPPWKVIRGFRESNGAVLVHLNNVSGGVLAGDRLAMDIEVDAGVSAVVTTTGATRLYRHRPGMGNSEQRATFRIGEGATLEYLPDPLIPFAGSRHAQRARFSLQPRAALFWWEVLAPGRQAAGEAFRFDYLCIDSEISLEDVPLLRETFLLEPRERPLAVNARMGQYSYLASFYVCQGGRSPQFWRDCEDELNALASEITRPGEALWGSSTLQSDGVIVRGLSTSQRFISGALIKFWRTAKKAIKNEDPVPPRKVY